MSLNYELYCSSIVHYHNTGAPRIVNGTLLNITGVDHTVHVVRGERPHPCIFQFNQSYALVCNVSGVPAPQVTWYHQRLLLGEITIITNRTNGLVQYNIDSSTSVLVISNMTANTTGLYYCNATNDIGFDLLTVQALIARKCT